ncbi:helix-turn-helix domain-containing protein [Streptomonospora wellingtoniae]|uniref:Helix-turn-helix domain-containing protein n=1 Tax=Streptomonospora wellingtoniae TaxID=3075544 RepID=A0ABU2L0J7_9ACTN|nr:helix-turn-helix domain-containing protein [Streptomonospora sp. DSM 45055]MDT0305087.1 helix-turn-helix domain-containing protein [Streptomonospora sp. DSM 45055]
MGFKLYRHVFDHAPDGLDSAARLVLLAIADDANDETRESLYLGQELLCHRTGLTPATLKKALQRLATAGYELRQPIGTDAVGRPIYALKGHHTVYRVPVFPERSDVPAKGGSSSPLRGPAATERGEQVPERGEHVPSKGGSSSPPSPQSPQDSPQSVPREDAATAAAEELGAATGRTVTPEWGRRVAEDLLAAARGPLRDEAAYVRKAIRKRAEQNRTKDLLPTPTPASARDLPAEVPVLPAPAPPVEEAPCGHGWPADDADGCFRCAQERAAEPAPGPPEDTRPDLTVHTGHNRPSGRHTPGQAPLLTTVPAATDNQAPAAPRTPKEWAALARAGLATGTDNTQ